MINLAHRTILFTLLFLLLAISFNTHTTNAATFNALTVQDLIDAINTANTNGEADTINLLNPNLDYSIKATETGYPFDNGNGLNGLPVILPDSGNLLRINGNGSFILRDLVLFPPFDPQLRCADASTNFRIFEISSGANVVLNDLGLQNGCATITGGAAILNFGQLTINETLILSNFIFGNTNGGGIYNGTGSTLMMNKGSAVSDNISNSSLGAGDGGGIYNEAGATLDINQSTVSGNETTLGDGGGIFNQSGGILMISKSTISFNRTDGNNGDGGAIYNEADDISIINSTISNNFARSIGGGLYNNSQVVGTKIFSSTIISNNADVGAFDIFGETISVGIKNSIVGNCNVFSVNNLGGNIFADDTCILTPTPDWDTSTMLEPLRTNGGYTRTRELIVTANPANPAIDAIAAVDCTDLSGSPLTQDQRTFLRPFNTNCDVGATELQPTGKLTAKVVTDPPGGRYVLFGNFAQFPEGCDMESFFSLNDQQSIPCVLPIGLYTVASALQVGDIDITCTEPPQSTTLTSVTMNIAEDDDVTCTFTASDTGIPLSVLLTGNGTGTVNIDPPDEDCTGFCSNIYPLNNGVGLTAIPDANSSFTGWSGDLGCTGTNPRLVLAMGSGFANSCTAEFTAEFRSLTLNKIGDGTGTVTSSPAGINCGPDCNSEMFDFELNEIVTLTAVPEPGTLFKEWTGACSGTNPVTNVTMDEAKSCNVQFDRAGLLSIIKAGDGSGMVTSSPAGISCGSDCDETYEMGTFVILNTIPDIGSTFAGWDGSPDCMDGIVMMDTDLTCRATFNQLNAPGFHLLPLTPSVAGVENMLISRDGVPLGDVVFVYGFNQAPTDGSTICPGLSLDIDNFKVLTTQTANIFGEVIYDILIPANLAGTSVFIQAVDITSCMPSGLNSETFADMPMDPPVLLALNPGTAGSQNTMTATGAAPNGDVRFIWSFNQGNVTANNICPGFESGILNPRNLPIVQADGTGTATLNVNVPGNLAGVNLVIQAVDLTSCLGSNVSSETL